MLLASRDMRQLSSGVEQLSFQFAPDLRNDVLGWPCHNLPSFIVLQSSLCLIEPQFLRIFIVPRIKAFDQLQGKPGALSRRKFAGLFFKA